MFCDGHGGFWDRVCCPTGQVMRDITPTPSQTAVNRNKFMMLLNGAPNKHPAPVVNGAESYEHHYSYDINPLHGLAPGSRLFSVAATLTTKLSSMRQHVITKQRSSSRGEAAGDGGYNILGYDQAGVAEYGSRRVILAGTWHRRSNGRRLCRKPPPRGITASVIQSSWRLWKPAGGQRSGKDYNTSIVSCALASIIAMALKAVVTHGKGGVGGDPRSSIKEHSVSHSRSCFCSGPVFCLMRRATLGCFYKGYLVL